MKTNSINYNQYIITTKFVVNEGSLITRVIHDDEGDWQFLGIEQELCDSDALILSLSEILTHDPTLETIINLPIGKQAFRHALNVPWEICDYDEDED